jgi:HAE1 family hydrophobic/amphiphilic exporter-1
MFGGGGGSETAEFYIKLHEDEEISSYEVQERLREQMPPSIFPEITFAKASFTGTSTEVTNRPIQAELRTTGDLEDLAPVVDDMLEAVEDVPGLTDVDTTYTPGKPEIQFILQPDRASDFGLSNNDMGRTLRALVDGDKATTFREDGKDYDVVVRLKPGDRQNIEELRALRIPINGQMVPLTSIADVKLESSPTTIRRTDRQTEIIIGGNNTERNINEVQADMQERLEEVELPDNVVVGFGGNTEDQAEGFQTILFAMALSVVFIYMVLASQFASFLQPFVIMIAMPFSFIGAFLALRLTGIELTIFGMIGMVLLLGLVTKNSILLVDFTNRLYRAGMDKNAAITRAGGVRLRPILMTSIAIMMGNLPAAIGLGEGAELRRGLATIVIGGLITSTLLTLLFVPVAYSLLESATRRTQQLLRWRPRWRKKQQTESAPAEPTAAHQHTSEGHATTRSSAVSDG